MVATLGKRPFLVPFGLGFIALAVLGLVGRYFYVRFERARWEEATCDPPWFAAMPSGGDDD